MGGTHVGSGFIAVPELPVALQLRVSEAKDRSMTRVVVGHAPLRLMLARKSDGQTLPPSSNGPYTPFH